jgi:SprB-like repeat protein
MNYSKILSRTVLALLGWSFGILNSIAQDVNVSIIPTCPNSPNGSIEVEILTEDYSPPFIFTWTDSEGNILLEEENDEFSILTGLFPGTYCVTVESNDGCSAESCDLVVEELPISPYLKSVEVRADLGAGYGPLLYLGKWQSNGNCISYSGHSYPFNGNAETIGLKIRAFANEPLSELYIELPGLDPSTALGNSSYGGFIWEFPFPPGVLFGSSTPEHQILFDGKDMSNNPLLDLRAMSNNLTSCVEIPELQDDCAWSQAPIQGEDDVHIFEVGCMILSITVPPPPISGVAVLKILGASPPYKISWTGPNTNYFTTTFLTTVYLPANSAGDYILKVMEINGGCIITKKFSINTCPIPFIIVQTNQTPACPGETNGSLCVSAKVHPNTIGNPIFNFSWPSGTASSSGNSSCVTGIANGTYCVTVTESTCNQTMIQCFDIDYSSTLDINSIVDGSNGCGTLPTGSIQLIISGGRSPYSFLWDNGQTNNPLTGLLAGTYKVTVTDNCGSTKTKSVTVGNNSIINVIPSVSRACTGQENGFINLTVSGDAPPYSFLWSNGATTQNIQNLAPGTYTVTVTDACGKSATKTRTVFTYAPPTITFNSMSPDCMQPGGQGSLDISVSGGIGTNYSYLWSSGATTQDINGVISGSYTVTVADGKGCTSSGNYSILRDNLAVSSNSIVTAATCSNTSDGSIDLVIVPSNWQPQIYSYSWSNGATTEDITGIPGGWHTVTVTDGVGCLIIQQIAKNRIW